MARRRAGRASRRCARRGVERVGAGERALGGHVGEGAELRVARRDARERRLDDLARADLAAANGGGDGFAPNSSRSASLTA